MNKAEAWLDAVARSAREDRIAGDPRWDALAAGQASAEDEAALRGIAERSPEGRAAYEAFRAFDAGERADLEALVLGEGEGAQATSTEQASAPAAPHSDPESARETARGAAPAGQAGTVVPFRRRRMLVALSAVTSLAAAAAAIALLRPGVDPALPAYELILSRGEQSDRFDAAVGERIPHLGPGSRIEIVLRPATPTSSPVAVRGALLEHGQGRPWSPPVEITPEGTVRIAGTREAVFPGVPDGLWELVLAVGRPEALPDNPAAVALGSAPNPAVRLLRTSILLAGAPPGAPR